MKKRYLKEAIPIASDIIIALVVAILFIKAPSDQDLKIYYLSKIDYLFIIGIGYFCYALIHSVLCCVFVKNFFAATLVKVIFISIAATLAFTPRSVFVITALGTVLCAISYCISKKQLLQKPLALSTALKLSIPILLSDFFLQHAHNMGTENWVYTAFLLISATSGFAYGSIAYSRTNQVSVSCCGALFIPNYSPAVTVIFSLFGALIQRHMENQAKNPTLKPSRIKPQAMLLLTDFFASLLILCPLAVFLITDKISDILVFSAFLISGPVYLIYSAWFGFLCPLQKHKLLTFYFFRIALAGILIFCFACLYPHTNNLWITVVGSYLMITLSSVAMALFSLLSSNLKRKNEVI